MGIPGGEKEPFVIHMLGSSIDRAPNNTIPEMWQEII
jgi:hypothetical protein